MSSPQADFEQIIRWWWQPTKRNQTFSPNQLGGYIWGNGSSAGSSRILRALNAFSAYFVKPDKHYLHWAVKWEQIKEDHPHLIGLKPRPLSPVDQIVQALEDEAREVRVQLQARPIQAFFKRFVGLLGTTYMYEAQLLLESDEDFPIPEGVAVRLDWRRSHISQVEAKLLAYDAINTIVILEVKRGLSDEQYRFEFDLIPQLEGLVNAVRDKLQRLRLLPDALAWKLLEPDFSPSPVPWGDEVRLTGLDKIQTCVVDTCLNQDITFVWGPPGTGKTRTLAYLIAVATLAGKKVLAVAIANVAVDQLALGVVRALEDLSQGGWQLLEEGKVLRFGHPRLVEVSGERRLYPQRDEIQRLRQALFEAEQQLVALKDGDAVERAILTKETSDLQDALKNLTRNLLGEVRIVLTTAVQTALEPAFDAVGFDLVVMDEASMMPVPSVLVAGGHAGRRIVIAGDFRQLAPISVAKSARALNWLHRDIFTFAGVADDLTHPALQMLITQRRMQPPICALINDAFYEGKLISDVPPNPEEIAALEPVPGASVVFVSLRASDGSQVELTAANSRRNEASALIVLRLAAYYLRSSAAVRVGVITPYRGQVSLIKDLLKNAKLSVAERDRVKVGTIHAFQGSEDDIIIWDLVEARNYKIGRLYHGDTGNRLANVAISRAKNKLVIIGDRHHFIESNEVQRFKTILATHFTQADPRVVPASSLRV